MTEKTIRKEEHPKLQLSCQTHRDSIGFQMLLFFSLDYPSILSSSAREQEHSSCPRGSDSRCQTPHCTGSDQKGHDFNSKSHQKDGCSISRKSLVLRRNSDHLSCRTCAGHWIFCFSQQCKCFRGLLPEQWVCDSGDMIWLDVTIELISPYDYYPSKMTILKSKSCFILFKEIKISETIKDYIFCSWPV